MDYEKYQKAFEKFLRGLFEMNILVTPEVENSISELCEVLRIGKINGTFYESHKLRQMGRGISMMMYSNPECRLKDTPLFKRFDSVDEPSVDMYVYPMEGKADWSEEELEKIELIMQLIFVFQGRNRLIEIAEKYIYHDDNGFKNIRYMFRHEEQLETQGVLTDYASVYMNLKHFASINQQIGRDKGTFVMRGFIKGLETLLDEKGIVCRLGGDNFVALCLKQELPKVCEYISGTAVMYDINQRKQVMVSAIAGIYEFPTDGSLREPFVIDRAATAYQVAKNAGKEDIVYFTDSMIASKEKISRIQAMFPMALKNEEFLVYYQPKISLEGGNLIGAEALCRWMHDGKLISPGDFIPVLEQNLDICKLDFYMLEHTCRDIRRWLDEGRPVVRVSVNLSRKHMMDVALLDEIVEIVDRYQVPHEYIEIELTETTTDVEFRELKFLVHGLQEVGISTSVDDFGIGYSSLNLIKEIPWNVLKVDRSFLPVDDEDTKSRKSIMFKYVVSMAQEMGLECIVEGVETKKQVDILKENNCDLAQGFYFDRPLPIEDFEERLNKHVYQVD